MRAATDSAGGKQQLTRFCLASVTRSFTDFTPRAGLTTKTLGTLMVVVMPVKSGRSYAGVEEIAGWIMCDADIPSSVYPSGAAFATLCAAKLPPAPGRYSVSTGCFQISVSFSPNVRDARSEGLPTENPRITRIGWLG